MIRSECLPLELLIKTDWIVCLPWEELTRMLKSFFSNVQPRWWMARIRDNETNCCLRSGLCFSISRNHSSMVLSSTLPEQRSTLTSVCTELSSLSVSLLTISSVGRTANLKHSIYVRSMMVSGNDDLCDTMTRSRVRLSGRESKTLQTPSVHSGKYNRRTIPFDLLVHC